MGDTIEDMDIEIEQKDNEIKILESRIGLPDCNVKEQMKRLGFEKLSFKTKGDRIMDTSNNSVNNHKYFKSKKQKSKIFILIINCF